MRIDSTQITRVILNTHYEPNAFEVHRSSDFVRAVAKSAAVMALEGFKIQAIKQVRGVFGTSLKHSKLFVEDAIEEYKNA